MDFSLKISSMNKSIYLCFVSENVKFFAWKALGAKGEKDSSVNNIVLTAEGIMLQKEGCLSVCVYSAAAEIRSLNTKMIFITLYSADFFARLGL